MADHNGYMPFPHTFSDKLMPLIGGSEWKVFHVVARSTLGWLKIWDEISTSQFEKKTGLARRSVFTALGKAKEHGIIQALKTDEPGSLSKVEYALSYPDVEEVCRLVQNLHQYKNCTSAEMYHILVQKLDQSYEKLVQNLHPQKNSSILKKVKKAKKTKNPVVPTSYEEKRESWKAKILNIHGVAHFDQKLIDSTIPFCAKVREAFGGDCCNANIEDHQLVLMQLMGYDEADVLEVVGDRNTPGRTSQGVEWVLNTMEERNELS